MFFRKKYILAKIESTYGTDPVAVGGDAILTKNLQINPQQGNRVNRDLDLAELCLPIDLVPNLREESIIKIEKSTQ